MGRSQDKLLGWVISDNEWLLLQPFVIGSLSTLLEIPADLRRN